MCPLTKFEDGLKLLHKVDDDAVLWPLESTATTALAKRKSKKTGNARLRATKVNVPKAVYKMCRNESYVEFHEDLSSLRVVPAIF